MCGFLPPPSFRDSRRAPPHCAPSAAARAAAEAAKLGCENESEKAKKCFSVSRRAQSTAGNSRRRQARLGRQLRRTGTGCRGCAWVTPRARSERGGGAATAAAWAGPCSHHLGNTEDTRDSSSSRSADTRMPPARLLSSAVVPRAPGHSPVGARAQGTPNASSLGRWSANFLRVAPRSLARGSCWQAAPEPPRDGGEGGNWEPRGRWGKPTSN